MNASDVSALVERCRAIAPAERWDWSNPAGYESVPLCVIDAIFSIGVKYEGVERVVARYIAYWSQKHVDANSDAHTTSDFLAEFSGRGDLADSLFGNRQRTSTRSGILKADAVVQLLETLNRLGVQTTAELRSRFADEGLDKAIRLVHGQGSGVSAKYLFLLAGVEDAVKPDRMIIRFVSNAIGRRVGPLEAQNLVADAAAQLQKSDARLTPRGLDHLIWSAQRVY